MWSVRLALLLQAVARELAELALVRPFASNQEIQDIDSAFSLWNAVSPCGDKALAEVDIFLVYSRRLDENPVASIAAANVQNSFRARSEPWHRCFRDFHVEAANLTAAEDIYDSRGYAVRKDWVNGPNKVFRFILQSFLEKSFVSDYEAFFFMGRVRQSHQSLEEFDSTPLRPFWLDQFYAEVFHYPRTAIRGSRYRGDSWDNFLHHIPNSLLYHMNGNAIYFLRHPWLSFLAQKLEEDATSENGSVAFDVRMAQLTLEAPTRSDLQTAWTQNVPEGENPYQDDSLLVGNYANTLLNDSFEPPEFVRHGALANIFENLDESLVTLAVQAFHQANATLLMESLRESAFREVVVVSSVDFAPTPGTAPSLRVVPATLPEHMALCDLAAAVHTTFFLFTDTYHFIPGPTHVLVNGSRPVLPYIPASSVFCTAYPECTTSLDQAENFYGVKLNYHHNKYETLFHTLLAREFCQSWNLAAAAMGSFHSCDYQHGPTADDYIAWLISMDKAFDYMPKNKERVGWRQWSVLWNAHPADQRACSIYTESDALKRKQSIKECSLYIQDGDACNADENCTFRAIFEAGKCMSTSEFRLLPAMMDARTSTWTISTSSTTTSRTSTLSSSTRSRTLTSSWTTLTATSSTSTTRSTVSGTFSTVFASSTRTQSAQPTISLPTFCKEDGLPIVGVDVSNCIGRVAGESCSVICTGSFEGDPATFVCGNDGTFTGEIHCQESTCAVETLPDGFETDCEQTPPGGSCFVRCPEGYQPAQAMYICTTNAEFLGVPPTCELQLCGLVGLPETAGVDTLACVEGVRSGQSCEVGCSYGFEGDSSTYRCVQGVFEGSPPACQRKACEAPREEVSFSSSCGAELLHGQSCLSSCKPGFMGAATQLQCENGILTGLPPVCIGSLCSLEGIVIGTGLDTSDCLGKRTSESCTLKCQRGYTPVGQPNLTCQSNGRFHSEEFRCLPKPCGDLSAVPSFASSAVGNSCSGLAFGQVCAAFCEIGWQIQGNASVIVCDDSGDASQGFAQYFSENRSYLPAERTQPMFRCIALECTEGLPSMKGVSHDCEGKTTHETCQVNAQLGYFADRPSTLTCQADGGFQGDWPVILPQTCPNFSFSPGVGSTCRNATLGTECWAYCESGWIGSPRRYECKLNATGQLQLEALEGITCTISGNRNGRRLAQSCADANADVRLLNPSFLHSCASLQDGDVCVVHCSSGFAMLEAEPALLSCQDGQFVGGLLPSCSPRSCDFAFPTGTGVQHDCNGRKTGENCTAQCGEEFTYTFGGAETFTCTSSGNFLGTNPSCERKFCEDLQIPELYTHNCREKRSGDTCGVTCALGYYFASWGSQFLCNGTFQGTLPSCQPNPCTDVPALGEVFSGSCEGLTTGESCELSCGAGFSPNSSWLTCDESGAFLGAYPLCNPANCPGSFALDHNESIAHNCETVPFGRSCNVYCAPGYDLLDQTASLWSCQLNGSQQMLEGVLPLCEPARCWLGLPVSLQSYTNNCSGLAFKESCTLQCAMGYTAHGVHGDHGVHRPGSIGSDGGSSISSTYHCSSNGVAQTDNTRPNCTLRTCVSNLTLPGVLTTCEDVQLNGTCFAFCAPGYGLKGNAQRWHCDASDLPAIDAAAVIDGIGLRGFLPVCLPETCSYKIPWSFRFSHNCHNVTTWSSCEVECADPFVGGQTSLQCQPNGALAGQLPECNEVTFTGTSTSTSAFTQTATTTFIFLISTNLTLLVSDADALIAHPGSKGGFASALAQIFQLQPEEAERIDVELQVDSENLLVIAEVQSTDELRSLLDRLTLDEVNIIVNNYVTTAIDNFSQETLTVLSMEIEVLDGNQIRVWGLQEAADNPVMASTLWVPILAASCVLLVCCCSCAIRHQCRKSPAETRQAVHSEDQRQNDRHSPAKDFGSELEKPPSMADAGLVDAGIYLEEEGLDQDNEEVRLRLEDVGVFYEEGDFSESLSMQPEAGAESQAPQQESSASASVLPSQPGPGLSVLRHAKDFGSELEKPPSMADAGLVDAGIYLEEEGMDNDKAVSDAASEESDEDGLHL